MATAAASVARTGTWPYQFVDRGLLDASLAEGRQDLRDVVQEGVVGSDDQHAGPAQPLGVGVQQIRGSVQPDRGLAGAGRALDAQRRVEIGADEIVLVGLDGGDDVAHRADAWALDLLSQQIGLQAQRLAAIEVFVLVGRQLAVVETEPPTQPHAHPVGRCGPVERPRDGRAPVDHDRVAPLIPDVAPADVQDLDAAALGIPVGATEERRCVGVGGQSGKSLRAHPAESVARQLVDAVVGDPRRGLLHLRQALGRDFEVFPFGQQYRIRAHRTFTLREGASELRPSDRRLSRRD